MPAPCEPKNCFCHVSREGKHDSIQHAQVRGLFRALAGQLHFALYEVYWTLKRFLYYGMQLQLDEATRENLLFALP